MSVVGTERFVGSIAAFDAHVGLGEVRADDGRTLLFHCIVIADGTRTIEVGTRVSFLLLSKLGRLEATDIRPV